MRRARTPGGKRPRYRRPAGGPAAPPGVEPGTRLNTGAPVRPRQAASVILLRGGTETLEVLLVRRTPKARFMGGVWVFPGGAVDEVEGSGDEAHRAAAVRELHEEASDRARRPGRAREVLALDHPRAVVEIRFDTHFFLAAAARRAGAPRRRRGVRRRGLVHARGRAGVRHGRRDRARVPDDQAPRAAARLRLGARSCSPTRAGARSCPSSRGCCSRARSRGSCCRATPTTDGQPVLGEARRPRG